MTCDPEWLIYLDRFQTLIVGLVGALIAALTVIAIRHAAQAPIRANEQQNRVREQKRLRTGCYELAEVLELISKRGRQGRGTIKVFKATPNSQINDETRVKLMIEPPSTLDDWEFVSLLPEETTLRLFGLKAMLEDHNFDTRRAGGAFGSDTFGRIMSDRLSQIDTKAKLLANELMVISSTKPDS